MSTASALSATIDYWLTAPLTALQAVDPNMALAEGYVITIPPISSTTGVSSVVLIGRESLDGGLEAESRRGWVALGATRVDEDFTIPCVIQVASGGPDQSLSRRTALQLFDAMHTTLKADPSMGGNVNIYGELVDLILNTTPTDDASGQGRVATVQFHIHGLNRY